MNDAYPNISSCLARLSAVQIQAPDFAVFKVVLTQRTHSGGPEMNMRFFLIVMVVISIWGAPSAIAAQSDDEGVMKDKSVTKEGKKFQS